MRNARETGSGGELGTRSSGVGVRRRPKAATRAREPPLLAGRQTRTEPVNSSDRTKDGHSLHVVRCDLGYKILGSPHDNERIELLSSPRGGDASTEAAPLSAAARTASAREGRPCAPFPARPLYARRRSWLLRSDRSGSHAPIRVYRAAASWNNVYTCVHMDALRRVSTSEQISSPSRFCPLSSTISG